MPNLSEQMEDITAMIAEAREAVYDGAIIDMKDIQERVKNVCEAIKQDPPADEGGVHNRIVSIITNLDSLVQELKVQQNQVEDKDIRKGYKKNQDKT